MPDSRSEHCNSPSVLSGSRAPSGMSQAIDGAIQDHVRWLEGFGETSYDHQSFFAGPVGGRAKALYYQRPLLGTLVVAPMIFFEAFVPAARVLFWKKQRFPIADAHYAMGYAMLAGRTAQTAVSRQSKALSWRPGADQVPRVRSSRVGLSVRLGHAHRRDELRIRR